MDIYKKRIKKYKKIFQKLLTKEDLYYIITLALFSSTLRERMNIQVFSDPGCGSAWLEHLVWDQGVAGSNPVTPIDMRV